MKAAQDTVEILQALTEGKIVLVEEGSALAVTAKTPESEPKQEVNPENAAENQQTILEKAPETVKPTRRGLRR